MTAESPRTVAALFIACRVDFFNSLLHTVCRTLYRASCSLRRTPLHDWSLARDVVITSRRYYTDSSGYPSESVSSSKWHVWFASRCPGRHFSSWQMIAASCPTALGALCDQLTFWHSAVTATELLQPLNFARRTLLRSSCAIQTLSTDCSDDRWKDTFFLEAWTRRSVTSAVTYHDLRSSWLPCYWHPKSPSLVPIESSYAISYQCLIVN